MMLLKIRTTIKDLFSLVTKQGLLRLKEKLVIMSTHYFKLVVVHQYLKILIRTPQNGILVMLLHLQGYTTH